MHTYRICLGILAQAAFHIAVDFIAKIAHQATCKTRQIRDFRRVKAVHIALDKIQRIALVRLGQLVLHIHFRMVITHFQIGMARQANERIATKALTALHRFEQITERLIGQFHVQRQGRVQIGQ